MKLRLNIFVIVALFSWFGVGCQNQQTSVPVEKKASYNDLIEMNRSIVNKEVIKIKKYLNDSNLIMTQTQTGLWYRINKTGKGPLAKVGQTVSIKYKVSLLDGTRCYSSDSLGVKIFRLGQGGVESGLEEGLLLLQNGGCATFLMPPHLAHGIAGDNDRIPLHSIVLYEAEIVDLK